MKKKLIQCLIVPLTIVIIPALGNMSILAAPQLWILLCIGLISSIVQPKYHVIREKSNVIDKGTEVQIIWSVYITQFFAIIEATYMRYPDSVKWDMISTVTLLVMIFGFILRAWAVHALGKYFTMHLSILDDHKLIQNGPYKYIRHPAYASAFMTYVGTTVFLHAWYSFMLALIVLPAAWIRRIYVEEDLLFSRFGDRYTFFCMSVKRAIPHVW